MDYRIQKKLASLSSEQLSDVYKRVFGDDDGLIVLQDLKNRCFVFTPMGDDIDIHPNLILVNEGKRRVVIHIETQLRPEIKEEINEPERPEET